MSCTSSGLDIALAIIAVPNVVFAVCAYHDKRWCECIAFTIGFSCCIVGLFL